MGKTTEWEAHFSEASKRGYNMLHWAPLQQRGSSGSPYSIYDQLKYDSAISVDSKATDGGLKEIKEVTKLAREKYGLGGVTDVVLNHTAFDSLWLHEHPEAGESCCICSWSGLRGNRLTFRLLGAEHPSSRTCCRARRRFARAQREAPRTRSPFHPQVVF